MTEYTKIHLTGGRAARAIAAREAFNQARAAAKVNGIEAPAPVPPPALIPWRGFSGRGVRLRHLSPEGKEQASASAGKTAGPEGTMVEYNHLRAREMLVRCVAEVTARGELETLDGAAWTPVTPLDLEGDGKPELAMAKLFTVKDLDLLYRWVREEHDATAEDFEAVMGKAIDEVAD